jgi:hypothetical protein
LKGDRQSMLSGRCDIYVQLEVVMANDATVANQREILANQRKILANQRKLDRVLANQARILANQKKILAKRTT